MEDTENGQGDDALAEESDENSSSPTKESSEKSQQFNNESGTKNSGIETMEGRNSDANTDEENVDGKQPGVADVTRGTNKDGNKTMDERNSDGDATSKSGNVQPDSHRNDHNGNEVDETETEGQSGGDAITPITSTPKNNEAINTGNNHNNETPVGEIEPTRLFKTMTGVNHTKEMRIHSSQWLLYTGLFADLGKPGHFQEFMPNVNHGVRQNQMIANIINTLLGNPANIQTASERSSTFNNDMIFQRLYNLVSTMTMTNV